LLKVRRRRGRGYCTNGIGAIPAAYALEEMQHYELTEVFGNSSVASEKQSVARLAENPDRGYIRNLSLM